MNRYWTDEVHPASLPMPVREAWHREAWDYEQAELSEATGGLAYEPMTHALLPEVEHAIYDA